MVSTRIILVRHGETTWNQEGRYQGQIDTPLSEFGLKQGKLVAEALKDVPIDICYASPLSRAYKTACFCAEKHKLPVHKDDRLLEINHGQWEGLLAEEIGTKYAETLHKWQTTVIDAQMPDGECIEDVRLRSMPAFEEYVIKHEGKTVLVVAHDAVNKAMICHMLGLSLKCLWQIKQDNTCINVLEHKAGVWRIVTLNSTAHLGFIFSGIEQRGL